MDIPPEMSALALQVGGAIVTAMFTSGWNKVKGTFARSVSEGDEGEEGRLIARLDRDRARLAAVEPGDRASLELVMAEKWGDSAEEALRNSSQIEDLTKIMADLVDEVGKNNKDRPVTQVARADGFANRINQVGGNQYNFGSDQLR